MVTGNEEQLHNHVSANRDPIFVKCLGTRDVAMHAGASPHWCRRASCGKKGDHARAREEIIKDEYLMYFYIIYVRLTTRLGPTTRQFPTTGPIPQMGRQI